ncbi:hypothetical protein [Streptomyces pacificus]|uniref:Uncharacterized protein n=1 Tax=Streptomyces pacificus TaxID=2705029 RepID=A0A6A0AMX3_9ACTN|nr:hypothetical protein [Streptomyces pacificus]GFH34320.1 hypothetical protein SCWH03_05340 [Streptomyces pacificus]
MSLPAAPLLDFSSWGFLATPLDELLDKLDARIVEIPSDDPNFLGGMLRRDWGLLIALPAGMNELERDLAARGLLAKWYGVEVDDWPAEMAFIELENAA